MNYCEDLVRRITFMERELRRQRYHHPFGYTLMIGQALLERVVADMSEDILDDWYKQPPDAPRLFGYPAVIMKDPEDKNHLSLRHEVFG